MPVTATRLDAVGSTTDGNTFATNTIAFQDDRLYLVAVVNTKATTPDTPSLGSAGGITFVQVATLLFNTAAAGLSRITLFRGMAPSGTSSAAITITFPAAQTGCSYAVDELDNVETGGTSGAAAIVQSNTNAQDGASGAESVSNTLGVAPNAANAVHMSVGLDVNAGITAGSTLTELGSDVGHGTPTSRLGTFVDLSAPSATNRVTPGAVADAGSIQVEVRHRGGSGTAAGAAATTGVGGASAGASGSDAGAAATAAQGARIQSGEGTDAGTSTAAAVGGATAMAAGTAAGVATTAGQGADTYASASGTATGRAQTVGNAQRLGKATGTRAIDDLVLIAGKLTPTTFEE